MPQSKEKLLQQGGPVICPAHCHKISWITWMQTESGFLQYCFQSLIPPVVCLHPKLDTCPSCGTHERMHGCRTNSTPAVRSGCTTLVSLTSMCGTPLVVKARASALESRLLWAFRHPQSGPLRVSKSTWSVKQGSSLLSRPFCGFVPEKSPQPTP